MLRIRSSLTLLLPLLLASCSADAVNPPEPTVELPGSFVAITEEDGRILLIRTLRVIPIDSHESLLEAIQYSGAPTSLDEARALARDRSAPVFDPHAIFSLQSILSFSPEVVWFRTLSDYELAALR
jgi:hypothetical protein